MPKDIRTAGERSAHDNCHTSTETPVNWILRLEGPKTTTRQQHKGFRTTENADLQEVTIELGSCHDKSPVLVPFEDEVTMYDLDMADLSWTRSSAVLSCHMVEVNKEHANTKLLGDVQYERRHVE